MSSAAVGAEPRRFPLAAMLVLATITFTAITTELMPSGLLPQISEGLNVSEPVAGYLAAAYAAVIVVTVIPAARLLARIPRKTLLISLVLTLLLPLGGGTIPGAMILMTVWGVGLGAVGILDPVQDGLLMASVIPNRRYSSSRARHEVVRTRPCTRQSGCLQILFRR